MPGFISQAIQPLGSTLATEGANGEPPLPATFRWRDRQLHVASVVRTWRSTKDDRGDTYLKRHWFEFETPEGAKAVVYFERQAKRGTPRWWLFTLAE
jgi:Family of unknown function (DUF6504)